MDIDQGGWIKLYRASIGKGWLSNHRLWTFWCYCLLKASHKETTVLIGNQQVRLLPGQFVFGRKKAAKDLRMSERQTRTCIDSLKTLENVSVKTTNKYSLVTIINWGIYQGGENGNDHQNDQQPANKVPHTRSKEVKKENTPGFQPVLSFFLERAENVKGFRPEFTNRDFPMLKSNLKKHGPERVKNIILFFLDSEKSNNHISLAAALSADTINQYNLKWQKAKYQYGDNAEQPTGEEVWWR